MLRKTLGCRSPFKQSRTLLSFFPLGLSHGPKNFEIQLPPNNYDGHRHNTIKKLTGSTIPANLVPRNDLKLMCNHCRFEWKFETLTVCCHSEPTHNQREQWIQPTWMWGLQQPFQYWKYLPTTRNPRTHMMLAREQAKSRCNERRGQGLTTKSMRLAKEYRGISRHVSKIGNFTTRWATHFPFPT